MDNRWRQIEELYHAAREQPPDERADFVRGRCGSDDELQREVESLLVRDARSRGALDQPAWVGMESMLNRITPGGEKADAPLPVGTEIGAYRITASLGAGGMGQVYAALDERLQRRVAIKILPQEFSSDADRLRRFEKEARAASTLNHPNLITIYDVGVHGAAPYIVMELVDGKRVRDVIGDSPVPAARVIDIGAQIAAGLAKAHEAGIVHRDLKPENVMVSSDGFVKILDFGLVKLADPERPSSAEESTQTVTVLGVVMGTPGYMSPEQARGGTVDFRSDQFAFGTIVYEMITGRNPFRRDTIAGTMAAVIERAPEPLPLGTPPELARIVNRCLQKDPALRYPSTRELAGNSPGTSRGTCANSPGPLVGRRCGLINGGTWRLVGVLAPTCFGAGRAEAGCHASLSRLYRRTPRRNTWPTASCRTFAIKSRGWARFVC